ncbi:MAG: Asparagine synthetase [glutamine-hydrolyzing] 1 [Chlamydiae bacterium]|nr:Asparagine synthetase [glutamine-hydrolyzing] 1 [Chlamydiota bacterium]
MCGIAALFGNVPSREAIKQMTDLVAHRGPDGEGFRYFTRNQVDIAHLGHRRLSILDLSNHGNQPMTSRDDRYHITYNGEIYNYIELKRELEKKGHQFVSHCDTEVLLAAFCEWGPACLSKLNGMFAFVIYDSLKERFFVARDRFGIKPLYLWISNKGYVAFASEIKQLTVLPGFRPGLNHQRAYDFLNWSIHDHTAETLFSDVMQLRGGEYWEGSVDDIQFQPVKWYFLNDSPFQGSLDDAASLYREFLTDSINLRLRSDVKLGSCLSGGLDSSSIVCLIHDLLGQKNARDQQLTFSACSTVERFDERKFMDQVVSQTNHQAYFTTPDHHTLMAELDEIIWHQDEPFGTTSIFAQWEVFKLAKKHQVKVMLDGQGADEQLAGYTVCYGFHFLSLFRSMRWWTLWREMALARPTVSHVNPLVLLGSKLLPDWLRVPLRRLYRRPSEKPNWLSFQYLNAEDCDPFPGVDQLGLPEYCHHMTFTSSLPMLLHFEDRDSMAHSIEARTPFLDWRLVELTLSLSSDCKISEGITKRVLRESMKGVIPKGILDRRDKIGFATAEEVWMKDSKFRQILDDAIVSSCGIVLPTVLDDYDQMVEGKEPFSNQYWRIICFGRWMDRYKVFSYLR